MSRRHSLNEDQAASVKRALWEGMSITDTASAFGVSYPLVHSIKKGKVYTDIPWPDGTTGAMPSADTRRPAPALR